MSKQINWDAMYKGAMRGKVTSRTSAYSSRKEQIQQAYTKLEKAEKERADFARIEPLLKKSLLAHMVSRTPILVERPMGYFTEELRKSQEMDEIDRAYYNQSKSADSDPGKFEVVQKAIQPGTTLTFSHLNASLGQWIFKSSNGETIEIYDKPVIALDSERTVPNPGFWGLLTATSIYSGVLAQEQSDEA